MSDVSQSSTAGRPGAATSLSAAPSAIGVPPLPLRVIQVTPPGRGAIATLLVEGAGAWHVIATVVCSRSGRPLGSLPGDCLLLGRVGGPPAEEVVVRARSAKSVEVHCHGGHAAVAMIERKLTECGCQPTTWRDWLAAKSGDPIAAAAHTALAEARTERTTTILLDQYGGALRSAFSEIETTLAQGDTATAARNIDALLRRAVLGRHLITGWRVVLAGSPNVGKSSLINALAGYRRAIVHGPPGTTRDVVSVDAAVDGWPVELSDPAGLRADTSSDPLERAGIALAKETLALADLIVLVFDRSHAWSGADQGLIQSWPNALWVHNKCDLPLAPGSRPAGIHLSALRHEGMETLVAAIAERLVPDPPPPGTAVPFTEDQVAWLTDLAKRVSRPI
jgi:tRNA modification GTPase